jgi:hypothetical protein
MKRNLVGCVKTNEEKKLKRKANTIYNLFTGIKMFQEHKNEIETKQVF